MPTLTALSAATIARRTADLPHFVGRNVVELATTVAWRSAGSLTSGTDVTEAAYPGARAGDGRAAEATRPSTTAATHYLCIDLGAVRSFDVAAIIAPWALAGVATLALEAADDAAFTTSLTTLASGLTISALRARRVVWTLGGSAQTVGARYVRLVVTYASTGRVSLGELYLGSRLALPYRATSPVDPLERPEREDVTTWTSDTGRTARAATTRGRIAGDLSWSLDLADEASAVAWAQSVAWGQRSALYAPRPSSEPHAAALVRLDEIVIAERRFGSRDLDVTLTEHVPTLSAEGL
jgi:hypothetical protein